MLLVHRPFREPVIFMIVNIGGTAAHMVVDGSLDHVAVTRLITVAYTTAGVQLIFTWLGGRLHGAARNATESARRQAANRARAAAEEAVHAERRRRYDYLRTRIEPLLHGLATSRTDPGDDAVWRRVAIARPPGCGGSSPRPTTPRTRCCTSCAACADVANAAPWPSPCSATATSRRCPRRPAARSPKGPCWSWRRPPPGPG
ncbi:hypothetical protein BJF79_18250 [Actinomadura sp. CNU-125]|uniref:hypothetical protein n=1 Tax=Actinomadura sp. CNU-125 TaxID=1904961 RepID=UPI0009689B57|nr:hypothetical protein [Actinomadura sp. CNU-125]OLT16563.1 hypothetical protein BJF79_18250 [Actinomadura sp. CNU-125]